MEPGLAQAHLDLQRPRLARRQAGQVKLPQQLVAAGDAVVPAVDEDADLALVIVHGREDVLAGEGQCGSCGHKGVHAVAKDFEPDAGEARGQLPALQPARCIPLCL